MADVKLSLQPSEAALLEAASRIFAAYIQAGRVLEGAERDMIERCVTEAMHIAARIEELVSSDNELG
jgi:hypothetical protein